VAANRAIAFRDAGHAVAVVTAEPFGTLGRGGVTQQAGPHGNGRVSVVRDLQVLIADGESSGARTSQTVDLVDAATATVDVVIVDTPPLPIAHDATRVAPRSDAVLLVAAAARERTADAARANSLLRVVDGPVAGLAALKSDWCSDAAKPTRAGSEGRRTPAGSRSSPAAALRAPGPSVAVDGVASATTLYINGAPTAVVVESEGAGEPEGPSS